MNILHTLKRLKRVISEDPYIIKHRAEICSDHNLGDIFELGVSRVVMECDNCTLLQVGANTGGAKHDILDYIKRWQINSMLVEPQPDVFKLLQENYADMPYVICENVALAPVNGTRQIYRLSKRADLYNREGRPYGTGIASFDQSHVWNYFLNTCTSEGSVQEKGAIVESFDVQCKTLSSLIDGHGFTTFDILLIDTEGFDWEILKLIEIDRISPSIVKFEHKHLNAIDKRKAWEHLRIRGYRQYVLRASGDTVALKLRKSGRATR